jgi:hypothetical protein
MKSVEPWSVTAATNSTIEFAAVRPIRSRPLGGTGFFTLA